MAIYEYECRKCGEKFELRRNMNDLDDDVACPKCRAKKPRRVLSMFGSIGAGDSCVPATGGSGGG